MSYRAISGYCNLAAACRAAALGLGLLAVAFAPIPVRAASSEDIDATVSVEGPCLTVSVATVDFGAVSFSQAASNTVTSQPMFTVDNCGSQFVDIYASATDAVGSISGSWALNQWDESAMACDWGPNAFGAGMQVDSIGADTWLSSTADTYIWGIQGGSSLSPEPLLLMPCSDSNGVGETMAFTYTITAALP